MIVELHPQSALVRVRLLRVVESGFEVTATTASWSISIFSAVLLCDPDLLIHDCDSSFSTNALDVNFVRIVNLGISGISFGCIRDCVRIWEILDIDMVVLIASDNRFAGETLDCKDSCLVPSARLNDPDGRSGLHDIPVGETNEILIGNILHAQVRAEVPSQVEPGTDLFRNIPKSLLAKLNQLIKRIPVMERCVRRLTLGTHK